MGQVKRAVTTNGDRIKQLRTALGWKAENLADHSGLNLKTVRTAESGKGVDLSSLGLIAEALGVEVGELTSKESPSEPSSTLSTQPIKGIKVWIGDSSTYTLDTPREVLAYLLGQSIDAQQNIVVIEITKGSIIVELEMSEEDVLRLVAAFAEARLDGIHVEAIRVPATTGPLAAGLLEIIHRGEVVTDAMTDPATETMTLLRNPNQALGFSVEEAPTAHKPTTLRDRIIVWLRRHWILAASTLLLMIVAASLTYCFAVRREAFKIAGSVNRSLANQVGMIVYAFFPPNATTGRTQWERLIAARTNHPSVPLRVVIIPIPKDQRAEAIASDVSIDKAVQAGIEVFILIDCDDGRRQPEVLAQKVELWHKRYGDKLSGFFFYRPPPDKKHVADYANLFKTVRSLSSQYSIITCCFITACDEGFLSTAGSDVICIQTDGVVPDAPIWFAKYEPSRFGAIMATVSSYPKAEEYVKRATENHMNWVYAAPGDGWLQLPRFFEDEVAYIASLNAATPKTR